MLSEVEFKFGMCHGECYACNPACFVKFQALIATLEQFKCGELIRALCWLLPKINVFDHFFKVKVAEIFWGAPPHLPPFLGDFTPNPSCAIVLGSKNTM